MNNKPLVVLAYDTSQEVIDAMKATGHLHVVVELSPAKEQEILDKVMGLPSKFYLVIEQELIKGAIELDKKGYLKSTFNYK